MPNIVPRGTLAFAGGVAGFAVGFGDGVWAGVTGGADVVGILFAALLTAAVTALFVAGAAGLLEVAARVALWGRRARTARWARALAAILLGTAVALATVAAAAGGVERRNRFLAAGVSSLVAAVSGFAGGGLLPALARLLSVRRASAVPLPRLDAALWLLAPLVHAAVGLAVMFAVMGLRAPTASGEGVRRLALAGVAAGLLPALLAGVERVRTRARATWTAPLTAVVFGAPLMFGLPTMWSNHLRFLPWKHMVPLAIAALGTAGCVALFARGGLPPARRRVPAGVGLVAAMIAVTLATSESEAARKVAFARAALVGPVLGVARGALDRDHDGAPRLLGGGDCDDTDPSVHPGVLDFPDDGIDQDCDGNDASASTLTPPPFATVPASVPGNLNLLLVTVDTVRADHLGCYGYARATSPEIDRLAREGALFLNGWAHAPSTRYSMPAIATGRWPSAIAWDESIWWPRIAPGVRTIAEALKGQGYATGAFYSYDYFALTDRRGFERGVDVYRADRAALHRAINGPMESRGSSSREMADDTIAFLETHQEGKFFLWVHFYDPHLSYEPHAEVPAFGKSRVDLYDGEIRFTDFHLGRVFDRLRTLGLWDRTAIVVTGDHGEGFGEHGVTEHGFDLYGPQTKVPLIVRVPGLAPRRIRAPAGHVDLAPTLLNLARGPQEPGFLGRSLVPDLTTTAAPTAPVFQEVSSERGKKRGLVTEDLHVVWNWVPDNTTECYDLRADPNEREDLWGRAGDARCRRLKSDLLSMVSALSVPADVGQKLKASVFQPTARVTPPAVAIGATVGDMVKVVGHTTTPQAVAPGSDVEVAILFECSKPIGPGWRFFFHLMGPGGTFRNLDHVPVDGAMPPERWRPGQRILDRLRIPFPHGSRPGPYQVILGIYRGGERMAITPAALSDGNKALRLTTIQVH